MSGRWDEERKRWPVTPDKDTINTQAASNVLLAVIPTFIEERAPFDVWAPGMRKEDHGMIDSPSDWILITADSLHNYNVKKRIAKLGLQDEGGFGRVRVLAYRILREGGAYDPTSIGRNLSLQPVKSWNYQIKAMLKLIGPAIKFIVKSELESIHVHYKDEDKRTSYGTYPSGADTKTFHVDFQGRKGPMKYMETVAKNQELHILNTPEQHGFLRVVVPWKK